MSPNTTPSAPSVSPAIPARRRELRGGAARTSPCVETDAWAGTPEA